MTIVSMFSKIWCFQFSGLKLSQLPNLQYLQLPMQGLQLCFTSCNLTTEIKKTRFLIFSHKESFKSFKNHLS